MDDIVEELDNLLAIHFEEHAGKDHLYFESVVNDIITKCHAHDINPADIFNSASYSWYYGNIVHGILLYITMPQIMMISQNNQQLSPRQIREAIYVLYTLLIKYDININHADYYGETPAAFLKKRRLMRYTSTDPKTLRELNYLIKHNKHLKLMQNFLIRRYISRKQQAARREAAAKVITQRALEYILNPDTPAGSRLLAKRAARFYATI